MPKRPEGFAVMSLVAVLLFPVAAARAGCPFAFEIPDIRNPIDITATGSPPTAVLDLDDYVVDLCARDTDGVQIPPPWAESATLGDDNVTVIGNEFQVSIPSTTAPQSGRTTLCVGEGEIDCTGPVTVKTTTLLAAPLVDDFMNLGPTHSAVPYFWGAEEGTTLRIEPGVQPGGGGRLFLSVSSGLGASKFCRTSAGIYDATSQFSFALPFSSYDPIALHGLKFGSDTSVSLNTANLSIEADLNGLFVSPLAGFSDWARVTLTRTYDDGSGDSYSVAIADLLSGVTSTAAIFSTTGVTIRGNLSGFDIANNVSMISPSEVYGFEGVSTEDLMGYVGPNGSAAGEDYEPEDYGSRVNQKTSWSVTAAGQTGPFLNGSQPCTVTVTEMDKPAATYPGATSGQALKCEFTRPDGEGILMTHRGIDPSEYDPGDILTFTMNVYVDLNYAGGNADNINEGYNGITMAMALSTQPVGDLGSFNWLNFAPHFDGHVIFNSAIIPNGGFTEYTNPMAAIHGRWTRHQVSFRVPEIGQSVTGPGGTGDLVDPAGISPQILIARVDTDNPPAGQVVWLDNLSVTACPGPLCFAHGAVNCPMVAAGFGATYNLNHILGNGLPPALARGAKINGNFSTVGDGSTLNVGGEPLVLPAGLPASNASKGWPNTASSHQDVAFIGTGPAQVALRFPNHLFNQALVLTPNPAAVPNNYPVPSHSASIPGTGHPGRISVNCSFLDMILASEEVTPSLRVSDVPYAAGTGGPSTQNALLDNVSGVFGVRLFARTNAATPGDNPTLTVVLSDADQTRGLVGVFTPAVLPNGADVLCQGTVWGEYSVSGTMITFTSPQQSTFLANFGGGNPATMAALEADNPSRQLAQLSITRSSLGNADGYRVNADILRQVFAPVLGSTAGIKDSAGYNFTPGRYGTATVFVDEVGLYAVRDSPSFYDEDLSAFAYLP